MENECVLRQGLVTDDTLVDKTLTDSPSLKLEMGLTGRKGRQGGQGSGLDSWSRW